MAGDGVRVGCHVTFCTLAAERQVRDFLIGPRNEKKPKKKVDH
jgi:hypothetical protein